MSRRKRKTLRSSNENNFIPKHGSETSSEREEITKSNCFPLLFINAFSIEEKRFWKLSYKQIKIENMK